MNVLIKSFLHLIDHTLDFCLLLDKAKQKIICISGLIPTVPKFRSSTLIFLLSFFVF